MNTNNTGAILGLGVGVLLTAIFSGVLIWVVGLLGLGLEVDGLKQCHFEMKGYYYKAARRSTILQTVIDQPEGGKNDTA